MITEYEAHRMIDMTRTKQEGRIGLHEVIDKIYDSIGKCNDCKYYDTSRGKTPNDGYCKVPRDSEQILLVNVKASDNWYCADFERRKDMK